MNPWFARNGIYRPLQMVRGEPVFQILKKLEQTQWYTSAQIEKYQLDKLNHLINNVLPSTPIYRSVLPHHFSQEQKIKDLLANFKLLAKPELQKKQPEYLNSNFSGKITLENTSGSSGTPFRFPVSREFSAFFRATMYRGHQWANQLNIGDREARFYGIPLNSKDRQKELFKDFLMNRIRLSVFDMNDVQMHKFFQRVNQFQPQYLYGYVSGIFQFSMFLKENKLKPKFKPRAVLTTSEVLHPWEKELIESVWETRCFNEYGASELGILASECEEGSMHLNFETNYVEINAPQIHENGDQTGEIVVTNLINEAFPLIRYRLGDIVTLKKAPCICGRQSPVIDVSQGRINHMVYTPEGKKISGWFFYYIYRDLLESMQGGIQFRATQKTLSEIQVEMVLPDQFFESAVQIFQSRCLDQLGNSIQLKFFKVENLPPIPSGKFMPFVSELSKGR